MIMVDDKEYPWKEGMTVDKVLSGLKEGKACAVVKLDGKLVSKPHFETTVVPDGAKIILIPMIAGG